MAAAPVHGWPDPYVSVPASSLTQKQVPVTERAAAANICPCPSTLTDAVPLPPSHAAPDATAAVPAAWVEAATSHAVVDAATASTTSSSHREERAPSMPMFSTAGPGRLSLGADGWL